MKRILLATTVVLFATSAWGATPRHGDTEFMSSAPTTSYNDTTTGENNYSIKVDGDVFYIYNMSDGGGTILRTWKFQADGDFEVSGGDIELGHATDTTVARASAGVVTIEGSTIAMDGGAFHDGFSDFVAAEHVAPSYGELFGENLSAISMSTVYTAVTPLEAGEASGATLDTTNGSITVGTTGKYLVQMHMSIGTAAARVMHCSVHIDSSETNKIEFERKTPINDVGAASASGLLSLTAAEVLTVECKTDNSSVTNVTVNHVNLNMTRIE